MGSSLSTVSKTVPGEQYFAKWAPQHILAAWERACALRPKPATGRFAGDHAIRLNKREFREVFTELSKIENGAFLALPVELFADLFPDEANRIDLLQVLMLAAATCKANSNSDRAALAFSIYDLDNDSQVDEAELTNFVHILCMVMFRLGLLDERLPPEGSKMLGADCFDSLDDDHNGFVSSADFVKWIEGVVFSRRWHRMIELAREKAKKLAPRTIPDELIVHDSDEGAGGAGSDGGGDGSGRTKTRRRGRSRSRISGTGTRRRSLSKLEHRLNSTKPTGEVGQAVVDATARPRRNSASAPKSTHAAMFGIASIGSTARGALAAKRVKDTYASVASLNRVRLKSSYTKPQLKVIQKLYLRRCITPQLTLGPKQFRACIKAAYPQAISTSQTVLDRLFQAFDIDYSGEISYAEFVNAMSTLTRGSVEDRADLLFEVFDFDRDGFLRTQELVQLLPESGGIVKMTNFAERILALFHPAIAGCASREEAVAGLTQHTLLYDCFIQAVIPGIGFAKEEAFRDMRARISRFNFSSLAALYGRCQSIGGPGDDSQIGMSLPRFRVYMQEEFGCMPEMLPVVNRVFEVLDDDASGSLDWEEILFGLEKAMGVGAGRDVDRARFYFRVYDTDDSGSISGEEVLSMLAKSGIGATVDAESVDKMLMSFDADYDGVVTFEEFEEATRSDVNLLECFGRLFGVDHDIRSEKDQAEARRKAENARVETLMRSLDGGLGGIAGVKTSLARSAKKAKQKVKGVNEVYVPRAVGTKNKGGRKSKSRVRQQHKELIDGLRRNSLAVVTGVLVQVRDKSLVAQELKEQANVILDPETGALGRRRRSSVAGVVSAPVTPGATVAVKADGRVAAGELEQTARRLSVAAPAPEESRIKQEGAEDSLHAFESTMRTTLEHALTDGETTVAELVADSPALIAAASLAATELSRATGREVSRSRQALVKDMHKANAKLSKVIAPDGTTRQAAAERRRRESAVKEFPISARLAHALDLTVDVSVFDQSAPGRALPKRVLGKQGSIRPKLGEDAKHKNDPSWLAAVSPDAHGSAAQDVDDPDKADMERRKRARRRSKHANVVVAQPTSSVSKVVTTAKGRRSSQVEQKRRRSISERSGSSRRSISERSGSSRRNVDQPSPGRRKSDAAATNRVSGRELGRGASGAPARAQNSLEEFAAGGVEAADATARVRSRTKPSQRAATAPTPAPRRELPPVHTVTRVVAEDTPTNRTPRFRRRGRPATQSAWQQDRRMSTVSQSSGISEYRHSVARTRVTHEQLEARAQRQKARADALGVPLTDKGTLALEPGMAIFDKIVSDDPALAPPERDPTAGHVALYDQPRPLRLGESLVSSVKLSRARTAHVGRRDNASRRGRRYMRVNMGSKSAHGRRRGEDATLPGYSRLQSPIGRDLYTLGTSSSMRTLPLQWDSMSELSYDGTTIPLKRTHSFLNSRLGSRPSQSMDTMVFHSMMDDASADPAGFEIRGSQKSILDMDSELGVDEKLISKFRRSRRYGYNEDVKRGSYVTSRISSSSGPRIGSISA